MPPISPYDHTAPQMTPKFYPRPPPRPHLYAQTTSYAHRTPDSSAAVWQHGPQSMPRGYGPRDGIYYDRLRDVHYTTFNQAPLNVPSYLQAYAASRLPHMLAQHPLPRLSFPRHQISPREVVLEKPARPVKTYDGTENEAPKPKSKPKSKAEPKPKTEPKNSEWLTGMTRKKRRPSEIFNKNFGFHVASLRAPSDHTPQISPRTSISNDDVPSPSRMEESVKRQRVDSKSADIIEGFPFGKPTHTKSTRGRDLGSSAMLPRGSVARATTASAPRQGTLCSGEVHPGTLVDWNAPPTRPEQCDAYLAPERRRRSFPSVSAPSQRKRSKIIAMLARVQGLDATVKPFGPLPFDTTPTEGRNSCTADRKNSCTSERRQSCTWRRKPSCTAEHNENIDINMTPSGPNPIPSDALSTSTWTETPPAHNNKHQAPSSVPALKRAASDPSTDTFLRHVRASLEARRSRDARDKGRVSMEYPVFADELEKGFLDDAPL